VTLILGTITGLLLGLCFGRNRATLLVTAVAWYVFLAIQTAYLAKPGVDGFGGLNGNLAVRGANFAQYWLTQPLILALCLGLVVVGGKGHDRVRRRTTGSAQEPGSPSGPPPEGTHHVRRVGNSSA
jgi:hypothetical protein